MNYHWNEKVVRVTALVFTGDVEDKLQRFQWTPGLSPWRPFCLCDNPVVSPHRDIIAWWRHQMKTFSGYWPFVWGIHRSPMKSPHKGLWSFDIFFDLRLNKRLSKQWWSWWFDVLSCSLWRHCNDQPCCIKTQKETECTNLINRNTLIHKQLETHWCIPSNGYRCPWCWGTRPLVSTVQNEYQFYWIIFIQNTTFVVNSNVSRK